MKYFTMNEFACSHCGQLPPQGMDPRLLAVLGKLRERLGEPLIISSGYRCPIKNANTPGAASQSYHMQGLAADVFIQSDNYSVYEIRDMALECGADTACAYPPGKGEFVHIDMRGYFQPGWV